ncbi:MAG: DUF5615 family PIN-like protein [Parvularculaceae bacterium]
MRFLIDAQLPPKLKDWFTRYGFIVEHVAEVLSPDAPDSKVIAHAVSNDMIIVSKDSDFVTMVNDGHPQLLWVRVGNASTANLLIQFDQKWPDLQTQLETGQPIVELI